MTNSMALVTRSTQEDEKAHLMKNEDLEMNGKHPVRSLKAKDSNLNLSPAEETSLSMGASAKAIVACGLYSFCSVSMSLTNKSLASRKVYYMLCCLFRWTSHSRSSSHPRSSVHKHIPQLQPLD